MLLKVFFVADMNSLKCLHITRQLIKSKYGFGFSISGGEINNNLITKIVYRYKVGSRNSLWWQLIMLKIKVEKLLILVI